MTLRFSLGGRLPSAMAALQPPAYQAHVMPLADSVSPIVLFVCGGRGSPRRWLPLASASSSGPPLSWGNTARLVGGLRRIDGKAIRCDLTTQASRVGLDGPFPCRRGVGLFLELAIGIKPRAHRRRGVLEHGRACANQVLVVEIGPAECAHEEIVG